jgi:hypothetical protein
MMHVNDPKPRFVQVVSQKWWKFEGGVISG